MKCKICGKRLLPATANSAFRTFKLGYYCPKCKRLIPEPKRIKNPSKIGEDAM